MTPGAGAAVRSRWHLSRMRQQGDRDHARSHRSLPPALVDAARSIARLQEAALHGRMKTSSTRTYLKHRNAETAEELRQSDESLRDLCESVESHHRAHLGDVHDVVAGDISAARVLTEAASVIHLRNEATT